MSSSEMPEIFSQSASSIEPISRADKKIITLPKDPSVAPRERLREYFKKNRDNLPLPWSKKLLCALFPFISIEAVLGEPPLEPLAYDKTSEAENEPYAYGFGLRFRQYNQMRTIGFTLYATVVFAVFIALW